MRMTRVVLTALCVGISLGCRAKMPEKLTADGLLAVKVGMSFSEMEALIGRPLCYWDQAGSQSCFSEPTDVPIKVRQGDRLTLSYAEPNGSSPFFDPMIYISLTKGHVRSVYIKHRDLGICCMEGLPTSPFYGGGSRELLKELVG